MVNQSIVSVVQNYLRALQSYGIPVSFGVVFGSWVTGKADEWSDIDLLVVSPRFDSERRRHDINALWHIAADIDSRIEQFLDLQNFTRLIAPEAQPFFFEDNLAHHIAVRKKFKRIAQRMKLGSRRQRRRHSE